MRWTRVRFVLVTVAAALLLVWAPATFSSAPAPPGAIATAMDIDPAVLVSASLGTSDPQGAGTHTGPLGLSFPQQGTSFGILATGLVTSADDPDTNNAETLGGGGSSDDVSAQLAGLNNSQGNDLVELTLVLRAPVASDCLLFRFAFFSEEFPDFVGRQFNDTFTALLNGSNIAFDTNGNPINVNTNFGFNPANPNPNTGTTYDGTTGLLEAAGPVVGGSTNTLVLRIEDLGDSILDSAVFLDQLRFVFTGGKCAPGAQQIDPTLTLTPEDADNPIGTPHTVTATLLTGPFPMDGENIVFTVTGANPTSGSAVTNSSGVATFTYTGTVPGVDTITAFFDADGDGVKDANETIVDTATKEWINAPPDCSDVILDVTTLWPPNHKLRTITASGATDPDVGGTVTLVIDGITQDEAVNGRGDGNTAPDAFLTSPQSASAKVRAERAGPGDGRVYRVHFTATDQFGATCSGTARISVPHDRGRHGAAIDSAPPSFNSLLP
jgi:hypothetical protein